MCTLSRLSPVQFFATAWTIALPATSGIGRRVLYTWASHLEYHVMLMTSGQRVRHNLVTEQQEQSITWAQQALASFLFAKWVKRGPGTVRKEQKPSANTVFQGDITIFKTPQDPVLPLLAVWPEASHLASKRLILASVKWLTVYPTSPNWLWC